MRISVISPAMLINDIQLLLIKLKIFLLIMCNELIDFIQLDLTEGLTDPNYCNLIAMADQCKQLNK